MGWAMLYLFVALKVPILIAGGIIWWAVKQEPDADEGSDGGGGRRRPHPAPTLPHAPRRGPHREPAAPPPPRIRAAAARTRLPLR